MKRKLSFFLLLCLIGTSQLVAQGVTTSSMTGLITDGSGEVLPGANVVALHVPTGVMYGASTDLNGAYRIANMKVGGPYRVTISYTGFQSDIKEGVFLRLGKPMRWNVALSETAVTLDGVEVVAEAIFSGQGQGASTAINAEAIDILPTLNRNLNDFTRLTPQAKESFGGGFSIAGMNNRYNAIYIDGAVNNDVFGLAANGTNGGQTGVSPFSVDILDQIQVVVSPYDVTLGGFAGGGINAVTKSGTNQFEGTAYYFQQNESLVAKTNGSLIERLGQTDDDRTSLADFTQETYGFSIGGPIKQDKIHFFANAEVQADQTPTAFDFGTYRGDASQSQLDNLGSFLRDTYNYDPGTFGDVSDDLDGLKLFGKLNFVLNANNNLVLRHQYTNAEQLNTNGSGATTINFSNNGVLFPTTTNSSALELTSVIGDNASNSLIIGYTTVRDDRDPIGANFPYLDIDDGDGAIRIGSEQFSTANQLDTNVLTLTNNFNLYKGRHTLTFGTHNEFISFYNLFIRQNFGVYEFDSIDDFINGENASAFFRSYSLVDDIAGDGSAAAAEFDALQLGFYVQDQFQVNNQLNVTGGLRIDMPFISTEANIADDFNSRTLPAIAAHYDVDGVEGGKLPQGQIMISPRLGFDFDVNADQSSVIRGGVGVFTSRVPFVWPGGAFTNNGLSIGGVFLTDQPFNADPQDQPENPDFTVPSGQVDLFAKDFKYPQVFRTSLALDQQIGGGWNVSLEGIYTKMLNNVFYENINSDPTAEFTWTGGPDNRTVFGREDIDPTYTAIYLATNTSEGSSYNLTGSIGKQFTSGLNLYAAYTYGDSRSIFEGTSSQNSSQWRGVFNVNGRNQATIGRSDFSLGSRVIAALGYTMDWTKRGNMNTTISLFYEGESGEPYSYVYAGRDARNLNNETGSTTRNRSLIWIPASADEINLADASEWDALNAFIEDDAYLSANRGSYAEQNGSRTPFESQIDFKILQDVGFSGQRLQLSFDVFNFANLLNKNWGVVYNNPFDYNLIDFVGYEDDGTSPIFSFDDERLGNDRFNISNSLSRWRMRVGVRYLFN